eukprot:TRINITY_DN9633_c0_g1_i1.p1 TRINITY_DN9633_c0_g1~~TRINITY_DN9633_c0_g1_i1.p1  ORF type:complete len:542 (-),score=61.35 TRINITY_DN9633_c0_g1_i1:60-1583(-)
MVVVGDFYTTEGDKETSLCSLVAYTNGNWTSIGGGFHWRQDCQGDPRYNAEVAGVHELSSGAFGGRVGAEGGLLLYGSFYQLKGPVTLGGLAVWDQGRKEWTGPYERLDTRFVLMDNTGGESASVVITWAPSILLFDGQNLRTVAPQGSFSTLRPTWVLLECAQQQNITLPLPPEIDGAVWTGPGSLLLTGMFDVAPGVGDLVQAGGIPNAVLLQFSEGFTSWTFLPYKPSQPWTFHPVPYDCTVFGGTVPTTPLLGGQCTSLFRAPTNEVPTAYCCNYTSRIQACRDERYGSQMAIIAGGANWLAVQGAYNISIGEEMVTTPFLLRPDGKVERLSLLDYLAPVATTEGQQAYVGLARAFVFCPGSVAVREALGIGNCTEGAGGADAVEVWFAASGEWSGPMAVPVGEESMPYVRLVQVDVKDASVVYFTGIVDRAHQDTPQGSILVWKEKAVVEGVAIGQFVRTPYEQFKRDPVRVFGSNGFVSKMVLTKQEMGDQPTPSYCPTNN